MDQLPTTPLNITPKELHNNDLNSNKNNILIVLINFQKRIKVHKLDNKKERYLSI